MRALYLVGTPIGNLEDMTFRAVRILQTVDLIAAEDTRHTGKLLHHFEIKTPQVSYHEHNRIERIPELLNLLSEGKAIALVTDAGMPGISDPGYELVKACIEAGIQVVPIPGVSAVITALCAAGLPTDRFVFEGFLPASGQERQKHLESLQTESRTLILYEAPHRLTGFSKIAGCESSHRFGAGVNEVARGVLAGNNFGGDRSLH
jgi:16S rRNA (cytidine1402-2'-O)-methyltransferase